MPQLILISFLVFAVWQIKRDTASRTGISGALWIPTIWVGIIASRQVSAWLGTSGAGDTLDGSPVDRTFFLAMLFAAFIVLSQRALNWGWLVAKNWPLVLFYGFLLLSVIWANSPLSSFKRWFKESGNIMVALVILSEADPIQALRAVFVRCAYLLIPLSFIFIRWFPELGRRYNTHSGELEAIGVTFQKNSLGTMILASGLIFFWDWLDRTRPGSEKRQGVDRYFPFVVAAIGCYLLYLCDSKTSIVSLVIGSLVVVSVRLPLFRKRISAFGAYFLIGGAAFFLLDRFVGISAAIIRSLGRDMTFTGRTDVWRELLDVGTDPLLGTGFMSFWDDPYFRTKLPDWVAFSAHNGYLEIYLAGGLVGICLLGVLILATGTRINRLLAEGSDYAAVRFAIFVMMLLANFAESNFACMTPLGFLFLVAAIGHAKPELDSGYSSTYAFSGGTPDPMQVSSGEVRQT